MIAKPNPYAKRFAALFTGRTDAYGTGRGRWVREEVKLTHYSQHLAGRGEGLGIAPLTDDGMVRFASIDLDEPDFDAAKVMMQFLPGTSFLEESRSGNAHVHVFFSDPIEAWIPRGIMREATVAAGKKGVEIFPKQDRLREGMLGNYINLPYFGHTRPILGLSDSKVYQTIENLGQFVMAAESFLNSPEDWKKRARWIGVPSPEERKTESRYEFGKQPYLHCCCEYVIAHREDNPVAAGHRAVVYFGMAKMLSNCEYINHDEALDLMCLVNDASPDPVHVNELRRILDNAERGGFTSTGCADPVFLPYADPACKIAHGGR